MISDLHYHDQGHTNEMYHFKILVPSFSAGAIIGKKGGIISQLQEDTGAKVKMSKSTDFYPGTTERVCLISGKVDDILKIHEFIMLKIIERPDPSAKIAIDFDHKLPAGREKQVKILVPNSTASMIIGKSGSYIKQIKEESGSYIQISQNDKENHTLSERCITVIGDLENNKIACRMILAKIVKDPNSGRCLEVSYAGILGPVPNFDPVGSPFANPHNVSGGAMNTSDASYDSYIASGSLGQNLTSSLHRPQTDANATHSQIVPLTGIRMGSTFPLPNALQAIESTKIMLRNNGYSEQAILEIASAMNTLAHYGLLGPDRGLLINAPISTGLAMTMSSTSFPCPPPPRDIGQNTALFDMSGAKTACNSAATPSFMTTPLNTFNTTMSSGLQVAVSNPEVPSCSWSPGDMVDDDDRTITNVPGAEAAVSTPGPMKFLSGVFEPIHSFESGSSELDMEREFTSPTSYSNEHFLVRSESSMIEPFFRTSPTIASPNAASLPDSAHSFRLETNFAHPALKENPNPYDQQSDVMKINIEVAENIVGAIIGPEGKALADIARISNTNIKISKKGVFAPGTNNRIVSIRGDLNAIVIARYLIDRQITEEEAKRNKAAGMKFRH